MTLTGSQMQRRQAVKASNLRLSTKVKPRSRRQSAPPSLHASPREVGLLCPKSTLANFTQATLIAALGKWFMRTSCKSIAVACCCNAVAMLASSCSLEHFQLSCAQRLKLGSHASSNAAGRRSLFELLPCSESKSMSRRREA